MKKNVLFFLLPYCVFSQVGIETINATAMLDVNGTFRSRNTPETTATNAISTANFVQRVYADKNGYIVYPYDWTGNGIIIQGVNSTTASNLNPSVTVPIDRTGYSCSTVYILVNEGNSLWLTEFLVTYSSNYVSAQWNKISSVNSSGGASNTDTVSYGFNTVTVYRSGNTSSGYTLELLPTPYNAVTGAGAQVTITRIGFSTSTPFILKTKKLF